MEEHPTSNQVTTAINDEKPQALIDQAPKKKSLFRDYAESIIIAVLLALVIRTYLVQAFKIPSGSMEDTLAIGDHLLVNKFIYGTKIPFTKPSIIKIRD